LTLFRLKEELDSVKLMGLHQFKVCSGEILFHIKTKEANKSYHSQNLDLYYSLRTRKKVVMRAGDQEIYLERI